MADAFEQYSRRARQVVEFSAAQTRALHHGTIGPGHLLLGLIEEAKEAGTLGEIEWALGITAGRMREGVTKALGRGTAEPQVTLPYTAETRVVLMELAPQEARLLGADHVEPAHILLALISQDSTTTDVIRRTGVDLPRTRQAVINLTHAAGRRTGTDTDTPGSEPPGLLATVTRDLSLAHPHVIGRAPEIDRTVRTLTRHRRNVPLLVGEPGVGKEAVAAGVARAIGEGRVPAALRGRTVRALDLGAVLADPRHRARGDALIADLLGEVRTDTHLVLFLGDALTPLHLPEGTTTPLGLFRPLLQAPRVYVFGDCGRAEYDRRDPDPGLDRLVQPVFVEEPPADELGDILRTVRERLEVHHGVVLTDEAVSAAADLARDHVPDQALPGSAIGLLDEAGALVRMRAARSDPSQEAPVPVGEADLTQALAASSGVQAPSPRPAAFARRVTAPAEHDPYIWSMS
ncbi:Clp protease N-terminal domain-containing protein [Streptomyces sp. NPDC054794]